MGRKRKTEPVVPNSQTDLVDIFPSGYKPIDPGAREQQMIGLAVDLAEKRLRDGTATSQIVEHYLKLGATRANLELQMAEQQLALMKAKTAAIEAENSEKRDYQAVLEALRSYNGIGEYDIPWP